MSEGEPRPVRLELAPDDFFMLLGLLAALQKEHHLADVREIAGEMLEKVKRGVVLPP